MDKPDFSQFVSESDIAIIGIACRFPGAKDVDELWHSLQAGKDSISFFSDPELLASGVDPAWLSHPSYVKAQAVLADIELFDASFFDVSPAEAEMIDPQQRLFLECAWQALESAGYDVESYGGAIAVYAGTSLNTYLLHNLIPSLDTSESAALYRLMLANGQDFLSTRVSYKLNLKGPSLNVQTACSTSLVATHLGCQSLLNGECDMALAGGVSIRVPHRAGYLYQEGMILSPNGQCRAFDAQAQGTVGGNGLGIVVLKRLAEAIADGDYIYATIKGSAINNDGAVKVGYTAPSVEGQAAVISEAQTVSGVAAETVTYIEAHGTGTHLGDPIEIAGLTAAFGQASKQKQFCAIGSIKTNIGHLDAAAGVAGLIKTALSLQHRQIPPSLHFDSPNPQIDFGHSPFYVNTRLAEWTANGTPLRAGVSSFGIGGTNAHVVLEEAPPREASGAARPWQVLLLSAKTETALDQVTTNLATHLQQNPELNLADVAYTLSRGRQAFSHRRLLVCQETSEAVIALAGLNPRQVLSHAGSAAKRPVAFMFSGQGAQYVNMGLELYQQEPAFRSQIDLCSEILMPVLGCDLRQLLYPAEAEAAEAAQHLNQTAIAQPALFVFE
ncbi:MAG: type I polyketide synthase, partial [Leptolyngbya sp. SIO4C5]|nr:type I polyketide synthase [Leptolyngbya sp. SIO4C5]